MKKKSNFNCYLLLFAVLLSCRGSYINSFDYLLKTNSFGHTITYCDSDSYSQFSIFRLEVENCVSIDTLFCNTINSKKNTEAVSIINEYIVYQFQIGLNLAHNHKIYKLKNRFRSIDNGFVYIFKFEDREFVYGFSNSELTPNFKEFDTKMKELCLYSKDEFKNLERK